MKFNKKTDNHPIVISSGPNINPDPKHEIKVGDQISLKTDDLTVRVRIEEVSDNGNSYVGTIDCFEDFINTAYKGYKEGDKVEFTYDEIYSVSI